MTRKYLKYLKYLKKGKKQNQRLWHSLRSCRFKSKNKIKSDYEFASLIELFLLASLDLGANIMWSLCSVNLIFNRKGAIVIRERAGQNFDSVQSLVDTRSANPC